MSRPALPAPGQAALILGLPLLVGRALPLRDPAPDPGLFGPTSVTWRVAAEPLLVLGAARALLMQVAHPLVAAAVQQHSDFEHDPFRRLTGTVEWVVAVVFGTTAEAERACSDLRCMHERVRGTLADGHDTAAWSAGTAYRANDAALGAWVLATLVDTLLVSHAALVRPLRADDADRLVREWLPVARLLDVAEEPFGDRAALRRYVQQTLAGPARPGKGSRVVAAAVLRCPFAGRAPGAAWEWLRLVAVGLLPEELRRELRLPWGTGHALAHRSTLAALRAARRALPPWLRRAEAARVARRRVACNA